ncbi:MAG: hypothetical protein ACPK85_14010 [Methanosarcina sp.]
MTPAIADPIESKLNTSMPVSLRLIVAAVLFTISVAVVSPVEPQETTVLAQSGLRVFK